MIRKSRIIKVWGFCASYDIARQCVSVLSPVVEAVRGKLSNNLFKKY
jgi:hypothetical protein